MNRSSHSRSRLLIWLVIGVTLIVAVSALMVIRANRHPDTPASTTRTQTTSDDLVVTEFGKGAATTPGQLATGFINSCGHELGMEMYTLNDDQVTAALITAKNRGVRVTVMLDRAFGGSKTNQHAYDALNAAGVKTVWAPDATISHIKTLVCDRSSALVMSANLNHNDYATFLDEAIFDSDPGDAAAIADTFAHDQADTSAFKANTVGHQHLIWSPGAEDDMVRLISQTHNTLKLSSEELGDTHVIDAVVAAAKRHVACEVMMNLEDEWTNALHQVQAAGCTVHVAHGKGTPYVHIKQIIVDHTEAMTGSQNITETSLQRNRELSLDMTDAEAVKTLEQSFDTSFSTLPSL